MANSELWRNLGLPLTAVFAYLSLLLIVAEILSRLVTDDPELTRKVVHIGSGNVILIAWWLKISQTVILSAVVIAALVAITSYILPILPSIESVGRKSFGTLFYALSMGVLTLFFWQEQPHYAVIGILIMAWGDGLAAIIGQRFGRHKYHLGTITKSWEGSLAMAIAAASVTVAILWSVEGNSWQIWAIALGVAIITTALEAFSKLGIDNLTVPLCGGFLGFWGIQLLL
ncbi:MAG: diacylglycerol/polyprenol kinase family protein [Cyanobacteria bacterium J06621_8]